ncbi:MAG: response regulator [Pseudomonadota bacterium]|nr:response regulator [Pseudomonadota bacterium]
MTEPVRVLVVEDQPDTAEVLALILERNGYQVAVAHDGLSALALVDESPPHCLLLDVKMPGLNGAELARRVRERHGNDIVLIAISGGNTDDAQVVDTFARVDHYLHKPIDAAMLTKVLPPLDG